MLWDFERLPIWIPCCYWGVNAVVVTPLAYLCFIIQPLVRIHLLSHMLFDNIVQQLELETHLDWDGMTVTTHAMHMALCRLLRVAEAGSHMIVFFCNSIVGIVVGVIIVLTSPDVISFVFGLGVLTILYGVLGILGVLFILTSITSLVKEESADAASVLAAARRHPSCFADTNLHTGQVHTGNETCSVVSAGDDTLRRVDLMSETEKAAHARFMEYLQSSELGAELMGICATKRLVLALSLRIAVQLPVILSILRRVLRVH